MDEVIVLDDQTFEIGDIARLWHSVVFTGDKMHLLCRREKIRSIHECTDPNAFFSQVEHSIYESGKLTSRKILDDGEECRVWNQNGQSYALYMHTNHGQMENYDLRIANFDTGEIKTILYDGVLGKNWMPLESINDFKFIQSMNPFNLLSIHKDSMIAEQVGKKDLVSFPKTQIDNYNIFRGGTNGLYVTEDRGGWEGYGHTNLDPCLHLPFKWNLTDKFTISYDQDFSCLEGFSIIDATSYFYDPDGNRWLGLCCSERHWFWGQRVLSILWPIKIKNSEGKFIQSMPRVKKTELGHGINIYPANEYAGYSYARGALGNILGKNELFIIKPKKLKARKYKCDFYYTGYGEKNKEIGKLIFFDKNMIHQCVPLMGTNGKIERVVFDLPEFKSDEVGIKCDYYWTGSIEFFHLQLRERIKLRGLYEV